MFQGVFTALITPLQKDGQIDETSFCNLVEWQIKEGIHGLVPVGTTGESPTLTHEEHKRLIEICVQQANKRVPVMAGAGSNSTEEAIELALHAQEAKADCVLSVTPYYNNPSQRGLYAHFAAIASSVKIPIFIYNIPGRSIVDMSAETMAQLAQDYPNIIGVKDATGKIDRVALQREKCSPNFIQFSGDDNTALGFNAHGGVGCISVVSNAAPRLCAQMQEACLKGDYKTALAINDKLAPLSRAIFLEPSPAGIKYAMECLGRSSPIVRKPIVPLEENTKKIIREALQHAGLLS